MNIVDRYLRLGIGYSIAIMGVTAVCLVISNRFGNCPVMILVAATSAAISGRVMKQWGF